MKDFWHLTFLGITILLALYGFVAIIRDSGMLDK